MVVKPRAKEKNHGGEGTYLSDPIRMVGFDGGTEVVWLNMVT